MKKLLYTFIIASTFLACRSIDKMVEEGRYDDAIYFATKKLAGKKNKKTKHVQGLEEAFYKINQRDLDRIERLDAENNPHRWEEVISVVQLIERRQDRIDPFLPLISKEGYQARFDMVDTKSLIEQATYGAADNHYMNGMRLYGEAETENNKYKAREAHEAFRRTTRYSRDHKDLLNMLNRSESLGISRILVKTDIRSRGYFHELLAEEMTSMDMAFANSKWRRFYINEATDEQIDYLADLEIRSIDVSPERETLSHHTDSKRISDGFKYAKNRKGEFKKDSTGKRIKIEKFRTVTADVTEIFREKSAFVEGMVRLRDRNDGVINSYPLSVEVHFKDRSSNYFGDTRALCAHDQSRKRTPRSFPHDESMIVDASGKLKSNFIETLHDIRI